MTEGISSRWWWRKQRALYAHPSALLLLVQLLEIVLYPLAGNWREARLALGVVGIVVILMALRLIHHTRGLVWHAFVLAALAIGLEITWLVLGTPGCSAGRRRRRPCCTSTRHIA